MNNTRLGSRGVLFTYLTFLFVGILVALVAFNLNTNTRTAASTVEVSVLNAINAKYDDITDDIITLDHPIGIPSIQQRILPFSYTVDTKTFSLTQTLPVASGKLELYFDLINAYSIFAKDQNTQTTYDGMIVDLNVPIPPSWGGNDSRAGFNLLPQCVQYQLLDANHTSFESTSSFGCEDNFNMESISRIDINVSLLSTVDDYSTVSCLFDGNIECPHADFNADSGTYFHIQFNDINCTSCTLSPSDKTISGFFDPLTWGSLSYTCDGPSCISTPLTFEIGNGIRFAHGGTPASISMTVQFVNDISTFYFQDANYNVRKSGFSTYKSNAVVFPK